MPARRPPVRRLLGSGLVAVGALGALVACGSDEGAEETQTTTEATPVPTIGGVGNLPDPVDAARAPIMVRPPVDDDGTTAELIGDEVDGNRVLLIGDSILSSTSSRYGNQMCNTLVPLGWDVQVEAEASRFIDFGNQVLNRLLPANVAPDDDFDVGVVFLGSNYGGDEVVYEAELREILDHLAPRPTLLFTVTQYRPDYAEVNEVVRRLGEEYDNVTVVDWEFAALSPGAISGDRIHPTDTGRQLIADLVATELGSVAVGEGECLSSRFRDDSRVTGNRDVVLGRSGGGSSRGGGSSSGGGSTGTGGSSGGGSSGGGATTTTTPTVVTTAPPNTTVPPAVTTAPQTTAPPTTPPSQTPTTPVPPPPDDGGGEDLDPGTGP